MNWRLFRHYVPRNDEIISASPILSQCFQHGLGFLRTGLCRGKTGGGKASFRFGDRRFQRRPAGVVRLIGDCTVSAAGARIELACIESVTLRSDQAIDRMV